MIEENGRKITREIKAYIDRHKREVLLIVNSHEDAVGRLEMQVLNHEQRIALIEKMRKEVECQ